MSSSSALYVGSVMHRRLRPRPHRLRYRLFWMLIDLDEIDRLSSSLRIFSHNRFNLVSFHDADHGDGSGAPLRLQLRQRLEAAGAPDDGGRIELLCMPRIFGYAFNPLSIYFCRDREGSLRAILYEVHNTFGERHSYFLPVDPAEGSIVHQRSDKALHVSPFLGMAMHYAFRVAPPDDRISVAVRGEDADGPIIVAALAGDRVPLTDGALLRLVATFPLMTFKVIGAIHWHALRMLLKGFRLHPHPDRLASTHRMRAADQLPTAPRE